MPLTPKQERFVAEYLVDLNATQAAIRAGYSAHTAKQQGSRLLSHADVRLATRVYGQQTVEKSVGSAEWVVESAVRAVEEGFKRGNLGVIAPNLAILARRHPEFSDKHEISADIRIKAIQAVANMSEEQLLRLAEGADREDVG